MESSEIAAKVRAARKGSLPTVELDPDIENEDEIINSLPPQAKAAMDAAMAEPDDDGEDEAASSDRHSKVPLVRARVDVLDRSQSFGFVSPPAESMEKNRLASFFQNGKYFDADGSRVKMPGDEENDAKRAAELERTRKKRAIRLRKEAEMLDKGIEPETPDEEVVSHNVNLTQWALYQRNYLFAEVRKAILGRYSRVIPTEDEARNFLIDEGVVTDDQVRTAIRVAMASSNRSKVG